MNHVSRAAGVVAVALTFAHAAAAQNLVQNSSFELGDAFWDNNNFVTSDNEYFADGAHSGESWLGFGCEGRTCETSQTIATVAGQSYTFSFWYGSDGYFTNQMIASWNGNELFNVTDDPYHNYQLESFTVVGTGSDVIAFDGRNDPNYLAIDDVSVVSATPEPSSLVLLASGLAGVIGADVRRRKRASAQV